MPDGTLVFDTKIDTDGFAQGTKQLESASNKLGDVFKGSFLGNFAANVFSGAIGKLTDFAKSAIDIASDLAEVQNVVDVTFGANTDAIERFAKSAMANFGLTELQAKQYSSTIGATLKSMGLTDKELLKISTDMTGLVGDMASFYNLDHETAFQKIRSGLSGETEPLKQLGINLSVANLNAYALAEGLGKTYEQMSEAERVNLRFGYIMQATADAQGDFVRTSDGYANQVRILEGNISNVAAAIGDALIPYLEKAIAFVNDLFDGPVENKLLQDVKDINAEIMGADEEFAGARGRYSTEIVKIGREQSSAESLAVEYNVLNGIANKTEEQIARMKEIAADLVEIYPELEKYVGKNGLFTNNAVADFGLEDLVQGSADERRKQAKLDFRDDALAIYEQSVEEYASLTGIYDAAYADLIEKTKRMNAIDQFGNMQFEFYGGSAETEDVIKTINRYIDAFEGLEGVDQTALGALNADWLFDENGLVREDIEWTEENLATLYELYKLVDTAATAEADTIYEEQKAAQTAFDTAEAAIDARADDLLATTKRLQGLEDEIFAEYGGERTDYLSETEDIIDEITGSINGNMNRELEDGMQYAVKTSLENIATPSNLELGGEQGELIGAAISDGVGRTLRVPVGFVGEASGKSHATGLDRVPYDGYLARLHSGEAVLNAADAEVWRRSKGGIDYGSMAAAIASAMPTGGAAPTVRLYVDGKELASSQAANNRTALAARSVTEARGYGKR